MTDLSTVTASEIDALFSITDQSYDLRAGTVRTRQDDREIYLSADLLAGVHAALTYEAGEAWGLVMQTCGRTWGQRVAKRLWAQLAQQRGVSPDDLEVAGFVSWLEGWFHHCGWGRVQFDLRFGASHGVVVARLGHSLYRESIEEPPARVDFLFAGLLGALLSKVAGRELGCLELGADGERALFVVSAPERIEALQADVEDGVPALELLGRLVG